MLAGKWPNGSSEIDPPGAQQQTEAKALPDLRFARLDAKTTRNRSLGETVY